MLPHRHSLSLVLAFSLAAFVGSGCSNTEPDDDGGTGGNGGSKSDGPTGDPVTFRVRLENVSAPITTTEGDVDAAFAPGVWAVHSKGAPFFEVGEADRGEGLESLAEDGDPTKLSNTIDEVEGVVAHDTFDLPPSEYVAGVVRPGAAFEFEITARPGERLSFAGMYAQSNDVFLAPAAEGIALFDEDDAPLVGDRSSELHLWDLGTEVNEPPGVGAHQAPRQPTANSGEDERGVVRRLDDGFDYPEPFVALTLETL